MLKMIRSLFILPAILLFATSYLYAGGLSSTFVEVKMKDLQPGKTYSVKSQTNQLLTVQNTTEDTTVDIEISTEKPVDFNLVPGYEPIPDLSWVKIEKSYFEKVGPGGAIETDISITIPSGNEYYGKKYQVYIYSHTAGQGTFRVGVMGRILLNMAPSK